MAMFPAEAAGADENSVANGGFEEGMAGWAWQLSNDVQAAVTIDESVARSGKYSLKLTNASPFGPHVYGRLWRQTAALAPHTNYRISMWCKGEGVGSTVWIGGGPGWRLRQRAPSGTYDWTEVSVEYTSGPARGPFELMIVTEDPTQAIWIDDVSMVAVGRVTDPQVGSPEVAAGLTAEARFYPAPWAGSKLDPPVVSIRAADDPAFGADVRMQWDDEGLILSLDVQDATEGEVTPGAWMWQGDSVQVAIDTAPEGRKHGYTETCYEFGLAPDASGEPLCFAWHAGGGEFEWSQVAKSVKRTATGYVLNVRIPWRCLSVDAADPPRVIGMDVLINDSTRGRRYVEWTPGIGSSKMPNEYAQVVLMGKDETRSAACIRLQGHHYDAEDWVTGRYADYAVARASEEQLRISAATESGAVVANWFTATLPECGAGQVRTLEFSVPLSALTEDGRYAVISETSADGNAWRQTARCGFERANLRSKAREILAGAKSELSATRETLKSHTALSDDSYIRLGIAVAERYIARVEEARDGAEWELMQAKEVAEVVRRTQADLADRLERQTGPIIVPRPTGGPVAVRDGVFVTEMSAGDASQAEELPCWFVGYGAWATAEHDFPNFPSLGVTIVQQERGPSNMNPDGTVGNSVQGMVDTLKRAAQHGIKVDLLLSPHYFPGWAVSEAPDVTEIVRTGFLYHNIDHPKARDVMGRWIEALVPAVKDEPALFSICLSNEPVYATSGHDPYSRPRWIAYLKERHGTLDALNALYGTQYANFEDVPPWRLEIPSELGEQRAFYDWARFNQKNFADWHAWMNSLVKQYAPNVPTHMKTMAQAFSRGDFGLGVDAELMCGVTDLAGNDCFAALTGSPYAYGWQHEQMWYDLQHSFKGQPVFDSENHFIPDEYPPEHIPPSHIRSVLWQGAIHHQGATVMWVWEDSKGPSLSGSIFFRPANAYSASRTMLDLNRLSSQVAALSTAKPRVALLYSQTSLFWEPDYADVTARAYTGLTFMGQPVTFVSERQLASGTAAKVDWIVVPHATHLPKEAVAGLRQFAADGGRVVMLGEECLEWDEYHRRHASADVTGAVKLALADEKPLAASLRGTLCDGGFEIVSLADAESGSAAWGVEYRVVPYQGKLLAGMINHLPKPVTVRLAVEGRATDLIERRSVELDNISLQPMSPILLEIETAGQP